MKGKRKRVKGKAGTESPSQFHFLPFSLSLSPFTFLNLCEFL